MMKQKIKITENELKEIIKESVRIILEDIGGTSSFSVNSPAGSVSDPTGQQKNYIDVPFGKTQRRKIYSPKGDAKGDVTKQESNVDMSPALKRKNGKGGSISIPKSRV